ncbi:MAG TPA: ferrochelatase [Prolixibacteraceae bacterium]|nr:ferrochelatase [Prolixibacteraceae bacterium]
MNNKTALLLINVGSPDKAEVWPVYRYLTQFLNDPRVIDLPWLARTLLVNGIIIPLRVRKSTGLYRRLWTDQGSPLITSSSELAGKLQKIAAKHETIFLAMRYGHPGIKEAVDRIVNVGFDKVIVLPLYPQYAESTTGSAIVAAELELAAQKFRGEVITIPPFYNHPAFISAFSERIRSYQPETYDHIVFSYHGLPDRQVEKCHPGISIRECRCDLAFPEHGHRCYRAQCYDTTRLIAGQLNLKFGSYSVSFQSRLSKNWLSPFTDETVIRLANEGKRKVLVAAPSFVTDCLETIVEIGQDHNALFHLHGGEKLQLVESLNAGQAWVNFLGSMIREVLSDRMV